MKKFVKPLVIAASVAAVAGIGAVSFAKWEQGSTTDNTDASGTLGSIVTMGDITVSTDLGTKKLVPYDQEDQYDSTAMAKEMVITLAYDGAEGATLTMEASGDAGSSLEYKKADNTWAAFTTAVEVEAGTITVRLNTDDEDLMGKDYVITFSATAPTVTP